ncbi:hypothetical protein RSW84_26905, partial [Escherichia coli]|uniref:hypothetical protein n=1 Tax=Escherichia coli TaxID=562 RepID=UPI0028E002D6
SLHTKHIYNFGASQAKPSQAKPTVIVKTKNVPSTATLFSVGPSTTSKETAEGTLTIIANFNQATN